MGTLAWRKHVPALDVCAGAVAARAVKSLALLLMALTLGACSESGEKSTPSTAPAPPPTTTAPEPGETASAPPPTTAPSSPPTTTPSSPKSPPPPTPSKGPDMGGGTTAVPTAGLPVFPWPPPRYSAFSRIAREWVASSTEPTLASVASRLEIAFDTAGYGERSYYWIPGGFALVSRLERIQPDATPVEPPARWAVETPMVRGRFIDHVRALFNAPPGFYRVIVFAATDQDFAASAKEPTSNEARNWISAGSLRLSETVGARAYTEQHYTTALIYEFERRADQTEARVKAPSNSPGRVHLEKAGLWQALSHP
jgi:hypothetical protein